MAKNPDNLEGQHLPLPKSGPIRFNVPNGYVTPTLGARPVEKDDWHGHNVNIHTSTKKVRTVSGG